MTWLRVLVVFAITACSVATPPPPSPPRTTNLGLRFTQGSLPNGLRVVLVTDPRASEVQVTMRYQVGAIDDPTGQEGVAHLVEHLMFEQVLGAQSLFARLEDHATSFNAHTSFEATTYVARASATHLEELLSVEAVRVGFRCTSISDSAFAREREVVLNEIRQRDASTELLHAVHTGLYPAEHPYRRRITGTKQSVGTITREQACAFADAHYAPSNAVLVVSGDVTPQRLDAALGKFLAKIPKRSVEPRTRVPPPGTARRTQTTVDLERESLVVAWPLPTDPASRIRVTTAAQATIVMVDSVFSGRSVMSTFGDAQAPMLGIVVLPSKHESRSTKDLVKAIEGAIEQAANMFRDTKTGSLVEAAFTKLQQDAIYNLFSGLEEGSDRDTQIAADVLAGGDPNKELETRAAALRSLTTNELVQIAKQHLRADQATYVLLAPKPDAKRHTSAVTLATPIHDVGQRRDPPDPAEARRPNADSIPIRPLSASRTRTLPNGLKVVLLPVTSVPTVDVRLVFASGTADEPPSRRGAALAAAHLLEWNPRHLDDYLSFAASGGRSAVDVETDHTSFTSRGVDMHLDFLLAGLRRWVRDGIYDEDVIDNLAERTEDADDETALGLAWRASLYGARHPYVLAGLTRYVSKELTVDDVERFHAIHHTPANATLVIAGRFDVNLADRWIDYLFADWQGAAPTLSTPPASTEPASIAYDDAIPQVRVLIGLPANAGGPAEQRIVAAMLSQIASDVRHQLGASYGFDATLGESRLATHYYLDGWVDAPRAHEAIELIRARFDALHADAEMAARSFVTARRRMITQLLKATGSAAELASQVERDVEMRRAPMSDSQTAQAVNRLTIDAMAPSLAELDLTRAAILMRGPKEHVDRAFAVLGRTPKRLAATDDGSVATRGHKSKRDAGSFTLADIEDSLALQSPRTRLTFGVFGGPAAGTVNAHSVTGYTISGSVGYRLDRKKIIGLNVSFGGLDGSYEVPLIVSPDPLDTAVLPVRLGGFLHGIGYDRVWGGVFAGVSLVRVTDNGVTEWNTSPGLGGEGGIDVIKFRGNRLSVYGRVDAEVLSGASYASVTLGLGFRR